jgi:hypothetical protein
MKRLASDHVFDDVVNACENSRIDRLTFSLNQDFIGLGRNKGGIYTIGLFLGIKVLSSK